MTEISRIIKKALPNFDKLGTLGIFTIVAGLASIFSMIIGIPDYETQFAEFIYATWLITICLLLFAYVIYRERSQLQKYAQTVFYYHYVNHISRDYLYNLKNGNQANLKFVLSEIVDSIASCFSIITGKQCRASIKDIKRNTLIVQTIQWDALTQQEEARRAGIRSQVDHHIEENTRYENLLYMMHGCTRSFICNNLPSEYRQRNYKTSSDKIYGKIKQQERTFLKSKLKWTLPYKSVLTVPIRYIDGMNPPSSEQSMEDQSAIISEKWRFWAFLCIDCPSVDKFDNKYAPELAAAFADILFILFTETDKYKRNLQIANNDRKKITKKSRKKIRKKSRKRSTRG